MFLTHCAFLINDDHDEGENLNDSVSTSFLRLEYFQRKIIKEQQNYKLHH